jgi:siroheme synthase
LATGAAGLLTREAWDVLTGAPGAVYVRTLSVRVRARRRRCTAAVRAQRKPARRRLRCQRPRAPPQHPTLLDLPGSVKLVSFDDVYEASATLQDVYPQARRSERIVLLSCTATAEACARRAHATHQIADRLLAAAAAGEAVVYAVPGDPCVAEMTVRLLRERAAPAGVEVRPCVCCDACSPFALLF